ncbi:hypothetical protein LN042_00140 [Kitasatospora sp. RB6PN24]|uniref:hypothetical protein n=1 Tax=Kitasatospora humi TaxID=2893891 RepID=UPI001E5E11E3|nr:hypothetical protein [Kitasatospora humi]MCC9305538.1 hypothetical protein [Kitasatospora humi]
MRSLLVPLLGAALLAGGHHADLKVVPFDPDPAPPGGTTTVHAFVANDGPDVAGAFTVTVRLPARTHAVGPYFPANCTPDPRATVVVCSFPAGLGVLRSATALVPIRLSGTASGTLTGGSVEVRSANDPDHSNDRRSFVVRVGRSAAWGQR